MSEFTRRLRKVDPNINIVPARPYHDHKHKATEQEWLAATGPTCPGCQKETFKTIGGLCPDCYEKQNEFEIRDNTGLGGLIPRSVIESIVFERGKK